VTKRRQLAMCAVLVVFGGAAAATVQQPVTGPASRPETRELNLKAYTELMRSDLRGQKAALITQVMGFTDAEDTAFWPVYREYEMELVKINDGRLALIEDYAKAYEQLTDAKANELITQALDLQTRRAGLQQKYYAKLKTAMSPRTAARVMQVEHQILLLLDLQVAASLPVAQ
jgi:hypothetical protein